MSCRGRACSSGRRHMPVSVRLARRDRLQGEQRRGGRGGTGGAQVQVRASPRRDARRRDARAADGEGRRTAYLVVIAVLGGHGVRERGGEAQQSRAA